MGPESHVTKRNGRFWGKNDTKVAKKVVGVEGGGEGKGWGWQESCCSVWQVKIYFFSSHEI